MGWAENEVGDVTITLGAKKKLQLLHINYKNCLCKCKFLVIKKAV